ncbi:hypothetical protein H632_c1512p1, partial [Helicosporidium sp. ATCC 50920]
MGSPAPDMDTLDDLMERLSRCSYAIPVHGDDVTILETPSQYLEAMLEGLATARKSVFMAALYAGIGGGKEEELLSALERAAVDPERPHMRMHLLLDAARATRPCLPTAGSTGSAPAQASPKKGEKMTSTAEVLVKRMLQPAADKDDPLRCRVSLFQTSEHKVIYKRMLPARVREVVGVQHIKALVFDSTVILTGANLGGTYLSTRQDRYLLFKNAPELARSVTRLLESIASAAFQLRPPSQSPPSSPKASMLSRWRAKDPPSYFLEPPPCGVDPSRQPTLFRAYLCDRLLRLLAPPAAWAASVDPAGLERLLDAEDGSSDARGAEGLGGPSVRFALEHPEEASDVKDASELSSHAPSKLPDTWLFPAAQAGFAGLRQEELASLCLVAAARERGGELTMSTPYLNLARPLERALALPGLERFSLLTSSPEANGFSGSAGVSRYIPLAYAHLERAAWRRLGRPGGRQGRW